MPAAMNGTGKSKKMANHYEDEAPSGSVAISDEDEVSVSVTDAAEDEVKAFVSVAVSAKDEASVSPSSPSLRFFHPLRRFKRRAWAWSLTSLRMKRLR